MIAFSSWNVVRLPFGSVVGSGVPMTVFGVIVEVARDTFGAPTAEVLA